MTKPYTEIRFTGTPEEINKQWVEARKNGIGGSDVASIMGLNKYSSPLNVWLIKTGREESPDLSDNQAVEWGNRLEDVVADKFADEHPELQVRRRNATMVSIKRPWAFANIDRWVTDGKGNVGILEVKTVGMRRAADWDNGVPLYYLTQVMHYMSVTGYQYAWVAVLIGGQEFREYYIERDEQDIQAINEAVDTFWRDFVETDTAPALIGNDPEANALLSQHSDPSTEFIAMLDEDVSMLDELQEIKDQMNDLKHRKTLIENQIKDLIGDNKGIETETKRITWVRSTRSSFDKKAFDAAHPGITNDYMKTSVTNGGLRISVKKGA
ncbi:yqaJ [Cryptobacterium sp. CAG:338]|jgi:putative phage-type endonuclease|nr:yqaJ [Cryptobacterium sp. CAG:338]